jgi:hypothetical protein
VCVSLCQYINNQLPGDEESHLRRKDTECSEPHPTWIWERLETRMVKMDVQHKILTEYWKVMYIFGMTILKCILKKLYLLST